MAPTLRKRKRHGAEEIRNTGADLERPLDSHNDFQNVFRRHFETHFKPLHIIKATNKVEDIVDTENGDDSEWGGLSEPEEGRPVEVIEHTDIQASSIMSKNELKVFMSARPPRDTTAAPVTTNKSPTAKGDLDEAANLKKDLALQRLLAESHLLDPSNFTSISGNNRHKATDLRLQSLGARTSILKQVKMPMSHRKGITAKKNEHEEKRRREARENGIILEKIKGNTKRQRERKRDRGIGGPGVGKFSGGTLKLGRKDIIDIEGPRKKSLSTGGRGRSRRGGSK